MPLQRQTHRGWENSIVDSALATGRPAAAVTRRTTDDPPSVDTIRRRWDRVTIGLCLGGTMLGMAGCILGAVMPYREPAAVALSILWWSTYFGVFGAAIGAIVAEFTGRARASRWRGREDAGERAVGALSWEQPATSREFPDPAPAKTKVVIELLQGEVAQLQARVQALEHRLQDVHS